MARCKHIKKGTRDSLVVAFLGSGIDGLIARVPPSPGLIFHPFQSQTSPSQPNFSLTLPAEEGAKALAEAAKATVQARANFILIVY